LVFLGVATASADSITIDIPTNNTFVGLCCFNEVVFNYFPVSIPDLPEASSATLQLLTGRIGTSFAPLPATLPPPNFDLVISGTQDAIGNGTGTVRPLATDVYTAPVSIPATAPMWLSLPFNDQGLAALNAARGGTFSFFGELTTIPDLSTGVQEWFAFDGVIPLSGNAGDPIAQLTLTPTPEPATIVLLGPAILGLWGLRRRIAGASD